VTIAAGDPTAARDGDIGAEPAPQPIVTRIMATDTKRQARIIGSFSRFVSACQVNWFASTTM
jgi:hypothetical protein